MLSNKIAQNHLRFCSLVVYPKLLTMLSISRFLLTRAGHYDNMQVHNDKMIYTEIPQGQVHWYVASEQPVALVVLPPLLIFSSLVVWPRLCQNRRLNSSAMRVGPLKSPQKNKNSIIRE